MMLSEDESGSKGRVLVVDDKATTRELLRQELEEAGFEVATASSGEECLEMARNSPMSVVILDIMMPKMDGIETCRRLKGDPATTHIPVLFLTGHRADEDTAVAALEAGGNDFLQKPYSPHVLLARVSSQVTIYQSQAKLRRLAMTDELTGLYSRRFLFESMRQHVKQASRSGKPVLACLMVDLDNFKHLNDEFGHLQGDRVLRKIGETIRDNTRGSDVVARFGGDEFAILLPSTDPQGAQHVAEKVRASIISEFPDRPKVSISVGIAWFDGKGVEDPKELIEVDQVMNLLLKRADEALYRAKARGRNCVCSQGIYIGPERRRRERLGLPVTVDITSEAGGATLKTADLSTGGLALQDAPDLKMGQTVKLLLHLEEERIQVTGLVVWTGNIPGIGSRCGIAFDQFSDNGKAVLERFLQRHTPPVLPDVTLGR